MTGVSLGEVEAALDAGDWSGVLRLTDAILAEHPGDDAAHELRARALLAVGRLDEAERHAKDAVRLDPEEIRYRELLAQVLSRAGAHRDAAAEFARLARADPRQTEWTVGEATERIEAAQPAMAVDAARRAVTLEPMNGRAQLALAQALIRTADVRGALQAASRATELLPGDVAARESLADAYWLADETEAAFAEFQALAAELDGADRARVEAKARALYSRSGGWSRRLVAAVRPVFRIGFRRGLLRVGR